MSLWASQKALRVTGDKRRVLHVGCGAGRLRQSTSRVIPWLATHPTPRSAGGQWLGLQGFLFVRSCCSGDP